MKLLLCSSLSTGSATFSLMALTATFSFVSSSKTYQGGPFLSPDAYSRKFLSVKASTASVVNKPSIPLRSNNWKWKFNNNAINIYYEEHERESTDRPKNILMIPTISDVSTVEEWRSVAIDIVQRTSLCNWRATIVDWPGLGYSDRPKMDYDADVMEKFLVDFINSPDSPLSSSGCLSNYHSVNASCFFDNPRPEQLLCCLCLSIMVF